MRPELNYTTAEIYAIRDFKEKIKALTSEPVRYIYAFAPNGKRSEDDYLLYTHIIRAVNGYGRLIDELTIATNVQL